MDLHTHSNRSDGTYTPAALIKAAKEAGLSMLALTDHDTLSGAEEAVAAGKAFGVCVLPSIEMDCESPFELHILGLDIDPRHTGLNEALLEVRRRRTSRNEAILRKLKNLGCDISGQAILQGDTVSRLHIALAMQGIGFVGDVGEAFEKYLRPGGLAYQKAERMSPREVIACILQAGGIPVLAHPCHIQANIHILVRDLSTYGLMGIEACYPASTPGQQEMHISLARQYKLLITCGSDFHGDNKPGRNLGDAWIDQDDLHRTYLELLEHHRRNLV